MRISIVLGTLALALAGSAAMASEPKELQPFAFLIGEWPAAGGGQPGSGKGSAVFTRSLQDRVIVRTNYADYPAQEGKPASRHDDFMILYASGGGVRADYYDNEGHVIRYAVSSPAPGQAVFVSEPGSGEPKFRLTYKLTSESSLDGTFEIAPPGSQDAFKPYLSWHSTKAGKTGK